MARISFNATQAEIALVRKIVARIQAYDKKAFGHETRTSQDWQMDLLATHANGNPLDFAKLHGFDDFNLIHDLAGICRHLDRDTGKLLNHFSPRASARILEEVE